MDEENSFSALARGGVGFLRDMWGGTRAGRSIEAGRQERIMNERENRAFNAFNKQYGDQSGAPDEFMQFRANDRASVVANRETANDERSRGIQAQRSGAAIAQQILGLTPEQQVAAMQQYAPILARAFGTQPEEIMQSFEVIRNSEDPLAALQAFDQSLAGEDERERRMMEESDLEQAAIRANAGIEEARIRGTGTRGRGTLTEQQQHQLVGQIESRLANTDDLIATIDETLPTIRGGIGGNAGVSGLGRYFPETEARTLAGVIQTVQANLGFDALRTMRADIENQTGGALGQVAVRELDFLQAVVARLDQDASPEVLRRRLEQVREHYSRFREAVAADLSRARENAGEEVAPTGDTQAPAGDLGTGVDLGGATPQADPLAAFLGRQ